MLWSSHTTIMNQNHANFSCKNCIFMYAMAIYRCNRLQYCPVFGMQLIVSMYETTISWGGDAPPPAQSVEASINL